MQRLHGRTENFKSCKYLGKHPTERVHVITVDSARLWSIVIDHAIPRDVRAAVSSSTCAITVKQHDGHSNYKEDDPP